MRLVKCAAGVVSRRSKRARIRLCRLSGTLSEAMVWRLGWLPLASLCGAAHQHRSACAGSLRGRAARRGTRDDLITQVGGQVGIASRRRSSWLALIWRQGLQMDGTEVLGQVFLRIGNHLAQFARLRMGGDARISRGDWWVELSRYCSRSSEASSAQCKSSRIKMIGRRRLSATSRLRTAMIDLLAQLDGVQVIGCAGRRWDHRSASSVGTPGKGRLSAALAPRGASTLRTRRSTHYSTGVSALS